MSPLESYFAGERAAGLLVASLGAAALAFAFWLWTSRHAYRAMVYPVTLIGLIQVGVGGGLYVRTPAQSSSIAQAIEAGPDGRVAEIQRMERVMRSFRWIEWVELVLLIAGITMILGARASETWTGAGMGLVVQSGLMFAFDLFAEHRAAAYLDWLRT